MKIEHGKLYKIKKGISNTSVIFDKEIILIPKGIKIFRGTPFVSGDYITEFFSISKFERIKGVGIYLDELVLLWRNK